MDADTLRYILLAGLIPFVWISIKVARHSFKFLNKVKNEGLASESNDDIHAHFDLGDFRFVADNVLSEKDVVATEEEIPLDNRHGSSPLVSEHEFARTVTSSLVLTKSEILDGKIKTSLWTLIETEVKKNLMNSLGFEIGEQVTRRVTVRLEAGPGQLVRYKLTWKQKKREGSALVSIQKKEIQIPYSTTYGLFHAIESIQV